MNQYFLVTDVVQPGATGYDIQLIVNSQVVKVLSDQVDKAKEAVRLCPRQALSIVDK